MNRRDLDNHITGHFGQDQFMPTKVSNLETYREALRQLSVAMDEVDQAHATLKDIDLAWIRTRGGVGIGNVDGYLESIIKTLEQLECDECGRAINTHPHADCKEWQ